jgi:hypothetical protein
MALLALLEGVSSEILLDLGLRLFSKFGHVHMGVVYEIVYDIHIYMKLKNG